MADLFEEQLMNQMHEMMTTISKVSSLEMRDRLARTLQEYAKTLVPSSYEKLTEHARSTQQSVSSSQEQPKVISPLVKSKTESEKA